MLEEGRTMADEQNQAEPTAAVDQVAGVEPTAEGEQLAPPVNENFKWYIIHAYSGFERKVR